MKCCVITLGCKVNTYESEYIKEKFKENNYDIVELQDEPDVVVVNTCTVTNQSDSKSRKIIRSVKKTVPHAILVVCGCSSENHKENLIDMDIDILIGSYYKSKIVELVNEFKSTKKHISKFTDMKKVDFEDMKINNFLNQTRAFVKIQDGCNNFCSYCIIPYMRGCLRSKDINIAYDEIKELVDNGYQEIVLTGIHTGSYGRGKGYDLVDLIKRISTLEKLKRIRISSIEITELDEKFMQELKTNYKICNHLHIPIQAGSDRVLKLMNRKYTISKYKETINKLRNIRPNINITTDLIVGFPTETEENFIETITNLNDIKFSKIHTFPYSKRDNTPASYMIQVNDTIKKDRVHKVLELSLQLENKYYSVYKDKVVSVLIEEVNDNKSIGHTDNYIKIVINESLKQNHFYKVKITNIENNNVIGIII